MMQTPLNTAYAPSETLVVSRNKVLRNTYLMLALTLIPTMVGAMLGINLSFAFMRASPLMSALGMMAPLIAVPILLQTLFIAALGYWLCRRLRVRHEVAGPATMIGASNFFELAVAVAIVLYGFDSGAALATVVGVLIEVPVMLWLVRMVNRSRAWYERALPRP